MNLLPERGQAVVNRADSYAVCQAGEAPASC